MKGLVHERSLPDQTPTTEPRASGAHRTSATSAVRLDFNHLILIVAWVFMDA
jgi:hypothetical protein